jgi:hypothetical protein
MPDIEIILKLTLKLSEEWVDTVSTEELIDFIKDELNKSLRLRGKIRKLAVVDK